MEWINNIGTQLSELSNKTYGSFVLFGIIVVVAIIIASYAFPDDKEEDDE